jgi:hypothetical protein
MKKYKALPKQVRLLFAVPIVLATFYLISIAASNTRAPQKLIEPAESSPKVSIKEQTDAPMIIASSKNNSVNAYTLQLDTVVTNTSTQSIQAYAIRYETLSSHSKGGGLELCNAGSSSSVLQSGQSASISVGDGLQYSDAINNITLSVDFVEFADGTTWGPDTYKSAERLDGQRVGARTVAQRLLDILKIGGPAGVINALETGRSDFAPTSGHSAEWLEGFQTGANTIRERLKQSHSQTGISNLESELRRPVDASDRK